METKVISDFLKSTFGGWSEQTPEKHGLKKNIRWNKQEAPRKDNYLKEFYYKEVRARVGGMETRPRKLWLISYSFDIYKYRFLNSFHASYHHTEYIARSIKNSYIEI